MNMQKIDIYGEMTIAETLEVAPNELNGDIVGSWSIESSGRTTFGLAGGDLREYMFLYVFTLLSHGAVVIDEATDGIHYWARTDRYGTSPEEIASAVVLDWIAQGEPEIPGYEWIAFALPEYLDSPENLRTWPKPVL